MPSTIVDSLHPHRVLVSTTAMETTDGDVDAMEDRLRAAVSLGEAFGQPIEERGRSGICGYLVISGVICVRDRDRTWCG
jgi:hypothetical protein